MKHTNSNAKLEDPTAIEPELQLNRDDATDSDERDNIDVLATVFDQYAGPVDAWLRRRFGTLLNAADREDVISMALVKFWNGRKSFDSRKQTLGGWFHALARNVAFDVLRKRMREREALRTTFDRVASPSNREEATTEGPTLAELASTEVDLSGLSPEDRRILETFLWARPGSSWASELAKEMKTSENAIRVRLSRSLDRLRRRSTLKQSES